jgi:hypothetical protein
MSKTKTVEEKYQKLTQIEHILKRPDTYIGDTKLQKEKQYVYENDKIIKKEIVYPPGLMKIFDEILVNRDHQLYSIEVNYWIKLINLAFKDILIVHWTSFEPKIDAIFIGGIGRISLETNGEIADGHFSEKGHLELSEKLMATFLKNTKFI